MLKIFQISILLFSMLVSISGWSSDTAPPAPVAEPPRGPLQLLHMASNTVVLVVPANQTAIELFLAPGRYLLQQMRGQKIWSKEIIIEADRTVVTEGRQLVITGTKMFAAKKASPLPVFLSTVPGGMWHFEAGLGIYHTPSDTGFQLTGDASTGISSFAQLTWGITDRLQWAVPSLSFAYRIGETGCFEWIPWAGLTDWGVGYSSAEKLILSGVIGGGLDLRWWLSTKNSLNLHSSFISGMRWAADSTDRTGPDTWRLGVSVGFSQVVFDQVTFNLGVKFGQNLIHDGEGVDFSADNPDHNMVLAFGSVQRRGLRRLPLVRIHLNEVFALDNFFVFGYNFATQKTNISTMSGVSVIW